MITAALIVAAGRGSRAAGSLGIPKQYAPLAGSLVLTRALAPFVAEPRIGPIRVVIHGEDRARYEAAVRPFAGRLREPVLGGATRQGSVRLGLEALAEDCPDLVLVHDAARPLADRDIVRRVLAQLAQHTGAIAAEPVTDTLKRADAGGLVAATVNRAGLWRAQTPQGFRFAPLLDAHRRAAAEGRSDFSDDSALAEWARLEVRLVEGSSRNIKITTAGDLAMAESLLAGVAPRLEARTGTGFDVHRFARGDHLWLGGVRIEYERALEGHSDADVVLHALADAILGALGDGDIGVHFPPDDARWKGAPSRLFVEDAAGRVAARGGRISNVDVTILCEAPRIGPHRLAIREAIAGMLSIDAARVGVKATTTEGLGFIGRGEGIAAMASATIVLPM